MSKGLYIVIEGIVGAGKSTQGELLKNHLNHRFGDNRAILTYEPGGSEIANDIRTLVQATEFGEDMSPWCVAYLYASSRAQTLNTIVRPALNRNQIVVSDRNFISSLTIQGYAQNMGIEMPLSINKPLFDIAFPDVVIYLKIEPALGLSRISDVAGDRWEKEAVDFYERIVQGYEDIAQMNIFKDKWLTIDVQDKTPHEIHEDITAKLAPYLASVTSISRPSDPSSSQQQKLSW